MPKTIIKLEPKFIDAFVLLKETSRRNCAYKGCRNRVKVAVRWRVDQRDREQQSDGVCVEHAIYLSNLVLSVRKFGKEIK